MTKYKILSMIIGVLLIIGMDTNTGFAQSNSGSNFLQVSVQASKQADYSIDSHYVVIPAIRKEIIQDKMKDNGQSIDTHTIGMLPESQANGLIDADKDAAKVEKDAVKDEAKAEKDAGKDAAKVEKDEVKVVKGAGKDTAKVVKDAGKGTAKVVKDAGKDTAKVVKDEVKAEKDADKTNGKGK